MSERIVFLFLLVIFKGYGEHTTEPMHSMESMEVEDILGDLNMHIPYIGRVGMTPAMKELSNKLLTLVKFLVKDKQTIKEARLVMDKYKPKLVEAVKKRVNNTNEINSYIGFIERGLHHMIDNMFLKLESQSVKQNVDFRRHLNKMGVNDSSCDCDCAIDRTCAQFEVLNNTIPKCDYSDSSCDKKLPKRTLKKSLALLKFSLIKNCISDLKNKGSLKKMIKELQNLRNIHRHANTRTISMNIESLAKIVLREICPIEDERNTPLHELFSEKLYSPPAKAVKSKTSRNCICSLSISLNPIDSACETICEYKYEMSRWSCRGYENATSVDIKLLCDGKFDCLDETDETNCVADPTSTDKYRASKLINDIATKLQEKLYESKTSTAVRKDLSVLFSDLQILRKNIMADFHAEIKSINSRILKDSLPTIFIKFLDNYETDNDIKEINGELSKYKDGIFQAMKMIYVGNTQISTKECLCRDDKCIQRNCTELCVRYCSIKRRISGWACSKNDKSAQYVSLDEMCDGRKDCPNGADEQGCKSALCHRFHFAQLSNIIQGITMHRKLVFIKDIIDDWKTKSLSFIETQTSNARPDYKMFRKVIRETLHNLALIYGNLTISKQKDIVSLSLMTDISQKLVGEIKNCDK